VNVRLLHPSHDLDAAAEPREEPDLILDLGLETVFEHMARGDAGLDRVARQVLLAPLDDGHALRHRHALLADVLAQPAFFRELHAFAVRAVAGERQARGLVLRDAPEPLAARSISVLEYFAGELRELRTRCAAAPAPSSAVWGAFAARVDGELGDDYLGAVSAELQALRSGFELQFSARLAPGNRGAGYTVRRSGGAGGGGWRRRRGGGGETFQVSQHDKAGLPALDELRDRGMNAFANTLAQATERILGFFATLSAELGFYVGCLNLCETLAARGYATCVPEPADDADALSAEGLYDLTLALRLDRRIVGNDLHADGRRLVVITGANQGGKSAFLRALGLAQLMLQAGMAVAADRFRAAPRTAVLTHFRREEDEAMEGGKLNEELRRMDALVTRIRPGALLLSNDSFASTNESEGSEIARHVFRALLATGVRVALVTHLYDLAHGFAAHPDPAQLFLRAERGAGEERPYLIAEGEPLPTSYGLDTFHRVFG
jgi:hypothetical protein